jgi:demethylmenaquinone methyltransferase/2-methoxy-6-polyprenyl-1,4-benzoquinol methylase
MTAPPGPSRDGVAAMFDSIAHRYDLANRVLSMGLDVGWRKRLLRRLPLRGRDGRPLRILDVATGTADLAIAMAQERRVGDVTGVDVSTGMLSHGMHKVEDKGLSSKVTLQSGDAHDLGSFRDFDVITISFGIRNLRDTAAGLRQMYEALAPGGTLMVLEFAEPTTPVFSPIYRLYRRHLLPVVGGALSGDREAYAYLDNTIASFPAGEAFAALVREAGFVDVSQTALTLGTVGLTTARRPASGEAGDA